jgi:hypothetical protein
MTLMFHLKWKYYILNVYIKYINNYFIINIIIDLKSLPINKNSQLNKQ